jgi:hypothetical protein
MLASLVVVASAFFGRGSRLDGTFAVDQRTSISNCTSSALVIYAPYGSSHKIGDNAGCSDFLVDTAGDFVLDSGASVYHHVVGVDWAQVYRGKSMFPRPLLADNFSGHGGATSTEAHFRTWVLDGKITEGGVGVTLSPGSSISTVRSFNFFEAPIMVNISVAKLETLLKIAFLFDAKSSMGLFVDVWKNETTGFIQAFSVNASGYKTQHPVVNVQLPAWLTLAPQFRSLPTSAN